MPSRPNDTPAVHADGPDNEPADWLDDLTDEIKNDPTARAIYQDAMHRAAVLSAGQEIRTSLKLSQKDVATAMGTTQPAVSALESGRVEPQLGTLQRYARALNRRLDVSFLGETVPAAEPTRDIVSNLWEQVETVALSPLLTALVTESDDITQRTATALARAVPLPVPIVRPILDRLLHTGWATSVGRGDDAVYSLTNQAALMIGIAIQRDQVSGVLVDLNFHPQYRTAQPLPDTTPDVVLRCAVDVVKSLYETQTDRPVIGVGVSLAGVVESDTGKVRFAPELDGVDEHYWADVDLERDLQSRLQNELGYGNLRVAVENDANALAILEYLGRGDHSTEVVLLSGTGIGVGYVSAGELMHGAHSAAGEGGHVIVDPSSEMQCRAGLEHRGCLETLASAQGVLRALGIEANTPAEVDEGLAEANRRMLKNDDAPVKAFVHAGTALGRFVSTTIRLYDPARVVLYASPWMAVRKQGDRLAKAFQDGVQIGLDESSGGKTEVVASPRLEWHAYNESVSATAAAAAAMRHFLLNPAEWVSALRIDGAVA